MIKNDEKYLMFIEPSSKKMEPDVMDEITVFAQILQDKMKPNSDKTKGMHICKCKQARSASHTFTVSMSGKSFKTNSLLLHYVKNHRSEVPENELNKLKMGLEYYMKKENEKNNKFKI